MKTYMLVSSNNEEQQITQLGDHDNPVDAYKSVYPIESWQEDQMEEDGHSYEEMVSGRFGMKGEDPADWGNYVDGDSNEAQSLIEVDWETRKVTTWPAS